MQIIKIIKIVVSRNSTLIERFDPILTDPPGYLDNQNYSHFAQENAVFCKTWKNHFKKI